MLLHFLLFLRVLLWEYFLLWVTELALAAEIHDYRLSSLKRKCISPVWESGQHKVKGLTARASVCWGLASWFADGCFLAVLRSSVLLPRANRSGREFQASLNSTQKPEPIK